MPKLRAQSTPVVFPSVPAAFRIPDLLLACLCLALLAGTAVAQQKTSARRSPKLATAGRKLPPAALELQEAVQALEATKRSGDQASIANASRRVAAVALRQLGRSKLEGGGAAKAVDLYRRSIDFEDISAAHVELATAYTLSGQADEATRQITNLLLTETDNAQAWRVQGQIWMSKRDYRQAVESLQHSATLQADAYTLYFLGSAFLYDKEIDKAKAAFGDLLKQSSARPAVRLRLSDAYRDAGYLDDAERELKAALALDPKVGRAHYRRGMLVLARNQWNMTPAARSEFVQEVQNNPHDFFGNYALGMASFLDQHYEEAALYLRAARTIQPQWPEPWLYLGLVASSKGEVKDGEEFLREAIELTGGNEARGDYQVRRAYYTLGRLLKEQGRNDEAAECMRHLRQIQTKLLLRMDTAASPSGGMAQMSAMAAAFSSLPKLEAEEMQRASLAGGTFPFAPMRLAGKKNELQEQELRKTLSSALNDLGAVEARQEQFTIALAHFHEAERWYAETTGLMRNMGMAAARLEDYPECVRALRPVLAADPTDTLVRSMLGMALFTTNSFAEAADALGPLGDSALERPELAYAWAASLVKINRYPEAGALLDKLEARPLSPETMTLVAQTWSQMANYPRTVATCHKALEQNPKLLRAHYLAGLALIRQDRPADAAQELRDELALDPNSVDAQFHLAFVLLQLGQNEEANQWLKKVLASNPDHPEANYEFGKELYSAGKTEEAIPYLEAAARLKPAFEPVHYQLQSAYRAVGRKEDADREAQIYRELKAKSRNITLPPPRETTTQPPNQ
ncbi:MAG TPA: tetratricopeptide repeat protein [Terriglobales bacterium]|nr:tetratricopeptide repeat protein [Terriglobales bacterium]